MPKFSNLTSDHINIRELAKSSDSELLKKMPGYILSLLEKIICQDEINRIIDVYSDYQGVSFLPKMMEELNIEPVVKGIDNLPEKGKCFFVANHPYGFADGLILTWLVASKYGNLKAIGNDVFMLIPQLRPLIAAVNVFGKNYREYIRELDKVYRSDIPITHFPAGLVSRLNNLNVQDGNWHKSFIVKAVECGRDVVPIYFPGKNSFLFYSIYKLRKVFMISTTLELALLPRELFNKRNRKIEVIIKEPIPCSTFDKTRTPHEWAQWVKTKVYSPDYH